MYTFLSRAKTGWRFGNHADQFVGSSSCCGCGGVVIAIVALAAAIVPAVRDPEVEMTGLTHRFGELTLIIVGETLVKLVLRTGADSVWSVG